MDPYSVHLLRHFEREPTPRTVDTSEPPVHDLECSGELAARVEYVSVSISRDEDESEEHEIDTSWGFGTSQASVTHAICACICQIHGEPTLVEQVTRTFRAIHALAVHDSVLSVNWPGTFWDKHAWPRVAALAGFRADVQADRDALSRARELLLTTRFHVRGYGSYRRKLADVHFKSPLVDLRAARLTLDWGEGEHEFKAFAVPKPLLDQLDLLPDESALSRLDDWARLDT